MTEEKQMTPAAKIIHEFIDSLEGLLSETTKKIEEVNVDDMTVGEFEAIQKRKETLEKNFSELKF